MQPKLRVGSGVSQLDRLLGGLHIGDNVVWHDAAGSLAQVFCLNFVQASQAQSRPLIYVSFDRSPKNLLDMLGPLADSPQLTLLDCFTHGKGAGSAVFQRFYERERGHPRCRIVPVNQPGRVQAVMDAFYGAHAALEGRGEVHFVFESLTGMQELWGGEEEIIKFYAHSCPRLYDLNTIAYWIMEKQAHSARLRAQINQIAQVAIELSVRRGTTSLTILKAERRSSEAHHQPHAYWTKDLTVSFDEQHRGGGRWDLGLRLKELRGKKGLSQTELAKLVGVTPSTISQVESNLIYPSLPALLKMAEVLSVEVSSFFQEELEQERGVVFPAAGAVEVKLTDLPPGALAAHSLLPVDMKVKAEPYLMEIPAKQALASHFFVHKGEEVGYLLSGRLQIKFKHATVTARAGDLVYLTSEMPSAWLNPGRQPARLLWFKIK